MDLGLKGKVAVVGGASLGLGFACARELAMEGCKVVIAARNEKRLLEAKEKIERECQTKVLALTADLLKKSDIDRLFDKVVSEFKTVHILVNNSGGPKAGGNFNLSEKEWFEAFEQVLLLVRRTSEKAVPFMVKQKWGRIVNITSLTVKQPRQELVLSNIFRAGVVSFAKTLAIELAPHNITVNCVAPGTFDTQRSRHLMKLHLQETQTAFEETLKKVIDSMPSKRLLEPAELSSLVAFLCSARASGINGATISVDGGQYSGLL